MALLHHGRKDLPRALSAACRPASAAAVLPGLARRVRACNDAAALLGGGRPFRVAGSTLGIVLEQAATEFSSFPEVFDVTEDAVTLIAGGDSVEARTAAVMKVCQELRGRVPMLDGWRNEGWPVKATFDSPPALVIERAAAPLFGGRGYGCHVNGLVAAAGGSAVTHLWVARRSPTKQTYPGKLDHLVAGGLAHGESPRENVLKECGEEAGIAEALAANAKPAGIVEYCTSDETGWGIKQDTLFCYDLEVPPDFKPTAVDGEVESFELWEIPAVIESLAASNSDWKPNVALVIIDMLVRRGLVSPEEQGYVDLVRSLRQ